MKLKEQWETLTWTWNPKTVRESSDSVVRNLLLHWFPAKISRPSLSFGYSFWLGTISAVLFFVLCATGFVLMFLYVPSVERAYLSIKDIEFVASYGGFIRGAHRIAAHLMVIAVFVHMMRAFLAGAYKNAAGANQNRPVNWIIGVALLLLTLLLSFTGYLLPWDQLAYWAITVGTNIAKAVPLLGDKIQFFLLGGNQIDQNTLLRFYVLHCFVLPAAVLLLFSWHMWRIRKDGGLACVDRLVLQEKQSFSAPLKTKTYSLLGITSGRTAQVQTSYVNEDEYSVESSPILIRRLLLVTLGTIFLTSLLAFLIIAPLEEAANPLVTPNPAKAPWYFLWLQELVADTTVHLGSYTISGAFVGGVLVPGALVLLLAAWPYLDRSSVLATGIWFSRERRRQNMIFLALVLVIVLLTVVGTFMRGPSWNLYWPWQSWPEAPRRF
jgi:cytochrome b-561